MKNAFVVVVLVMGAGLVSAQGEPGYVAVESLGLVDPASVEVSVNLTGAMLQALASSSEGSEADLGQLLHDITRVRVLVGRPPAAEAVDLVAKLRAAVDRLEGEGWTRIISVREEGDEEVAVLSLQSGDLIRGIAVLVLDGDEAVAVNVVGSMRPELVGRLLGSLGSLDEVAAGLKGTTGAAG
jgi:hypothetical protein